MEERVLTESLLGASGLRPEGSACFGDRKVRLVPLFKAKSKFEGTSLRESSTASSSSAALLEVWGSGVYAVGGDMVTGMHFRLHGPETSRKPRNSTASEASFFKYYIFMKNIRWRTERKFTAERRGWKVQRERQEQVGWRG